MGLILSEVTISFILPTSNAHRAKQLQAGDVIVEVDGVKANKDNIAELLRGEDVPESSVHLLIRRKEEMIGGWQLVQVTLARSSPAELADLSRLLQLFSRMRKSADRISEVHAC